MIAKNNCFQLSFNSYNLEDWYGFATELDKKLINTKWGKFEVIKGEGEGEGHLELLSIDSKE